MSYKLGKKKLSKDVEEDLIAEIQRTRMENARLKKLQALVQKNKAKTIGKVIVIDELRHEFKLEALLKYAEVTRSTFYYQLNRLKEPDKYKEITSIYYENKGIYGYRIITLELHNSDFCVNHKTVRILMKELGWQCFVSVQKYKSYKGEVGKICNNLLNREFNAK